MNKEQKTKELKEQVLDYEEKIKKIRSEIDELNDEYVTFDQYKDYDSDDWKPCHRKFKKSEVFFNQSCNGWDFYLYHVKDIISRRVYIRLKNYNGNVLLKR